VGIHTKPLALKVNYNDKQCDAKKTKELLKSSAKNVHKNWWELNPGTFAEYTRYLTMSRKHQQGSHNIHTW
jgi:hypothetical protein